MILLPGKDDKYWAGHFGPWMSNATVRVKRESKHAVGDDYSDVLIQVGEFLYHIHVLIGSYTVADPGISKWGWGGTTNFKHIKLIHYFNHIMARN